MSAFLAETVAVLRATPAVMRALCGSPGAGWVDRSPGRGAWSARQIVEHLILGEKTDWMVRARVIVEHGDSRPFEPFVRDDFSDGTTAALLDELETLRAANLDELARLAPTDEMLARKGVHPALGRVTLRQLLATWAAHDLNHVSQAAEAMAKRYRPDVGPWRAYLPALNRPDLAD